MVSPKSPMRAAGDVGAAQHIIVISYLVVGGKRGMISPPYTYLHSATGTAI